MKRRISEARVGKIRQTISEIEAYRFCGPSDDPDEISAVTLGFRHLLVQLQRAAGPVLPESASARLDALEVEPNDLHSALAANAEVEALLLDVEEAIEGYLPQTADGGGALLPEPLPLAVSSIVGQVLGSTIYHHKTLENLFYRAGAVGDVPDGNCVTKCQSWLERLHSEVEDPVHVLGRVVEEFMEVDHPGWEDQAEGRRQIGEVLARFGMSYLQGGHISSLAEVDSTRSVLEHLRERSLDSVEEEVQRSLKHAVSDPAAAVTAACAVVESMCKVYIDDHGLDLPTKQDVGHLWKVVSKHVGFDPGSKEDNDVRQVLSGLVSVVTGIGALRTHAGSAHGRGRNRYRLQPRHARLAIHAAHTVVGFLLETSETPTD